MQNPHHNLDRLLEMIVDHIDVPKSYYEKAAARHRSLGEWLRRDASAVARFDPDVRPQGSFRFGTVVRPVRKDAEYDLDNVCLLKRLTKGVLTQKQLKELYGSEILAYAEANGMISAPQEKNRCWRLRYADEVAFHLDTLPCVPEEEEFVRRLVTLGVDPELARRAVAITDKRHPRYGEITPLWFSSNPRGFARWFEQRAALGLRRTLGEGQARATVEDVPPYEWKTPLQRSIQILKRHRDVMFLDKPGLAPISMIITNLAARAYEGETDLAAAITNIVERMPEFVRAERPRVPNPAGPLEDYADKWAKDPRLEKSFWEWHAAVKADITKLSVFLRESAVGRNVQQLFRVELTEDELQQLTPSVPASPAPARVAPAAVISSAPKPWGSDD